MSRLTKLDKYDGGYWVKDKYGEDRWFSPKGKLYKPIEKLAHYEDLEEQGKLIVLPCKVGDTVWYIEEMKSYTPSYHSWYECFSFRIEYIEIAEKWLAFGKEGSGMFADKRFYGKDIGKTVFLTKEEAEAKLKGTEE
jgi:hypothetical protein